MHSETRAAPALEGLQQVPPCLWGSQGAIPRMEGCLLSAAGHPMWKTYPSDKKYIAAWENPLLMRLELVRGRLRFHCGKQLCDLFVFCKQRSVAWAVDVFVELLPR